MRTRTLARERKIFSRILWPRGVGIARKPVIRSSGTQYSTASKLRGAYCHGWHHRGREADCEKSQKVETSKKKPILTGMIVFICVRLELFMRIQCITALNLSNR